MQARLIRYLLVKVLFLIAVYIPIFLIIHAILTEELNGLHQHTLTFALALLLSKALTRNHFLIEINVCLFYFLKVSFLIVSFFSMQYVICSNYFSMNTPCLNGCKQVFIANHVTPIPIWAHILSDENKSLCSQFINPKIISNCSYSIIQKSPAKIITVQTGNDDQIYKFKYMLDNDKVIPLEWRMNLVPIMFNNLLAALLAYIFIGYLFKRKQQRLHSCMGTPSE